MKKNEQHLKNRQEFVRTSVKNPKDGAKLLMKFARKLDKAKGTNQIVSILSEVLSLSEVTIFNDFSEL